MTAGTRVASRVAPSPSSLPTRLPDMAKKADVADPTTPDPAGPEATAPAADDVNSDVAALSYEQARDELVDIVARLENGQAGLEESMDLWQRGEALATHCATWLDHAEARITAGD
jgi:exodeoxyribonuclease VII small subunit